MNNLLKQVCLSLLALAVIFLSTEMKPGGGNNTAFIINNNNKHMAETTRYKSARLKFSKDLDNSPAPPAIVKEQVPETTISISNHHHDDVVSFSSSETIASTNDTVTSANDPTMKAGHHNHTNQSHGHHHDYSIIIVHYHKTGYVLSRFLAKEISILEYQAKNLTNFFIKERNRDNSFFKSGFDSEGKEQLAFHRRGNWNRNAFLARRHDAGTDCPEGFLLEKGTVYLQESPDLYCKDDVLAGLMLGGDGDSGRQSSPFDGNIGNTTTINTSNTTSSSGKGTKIIHFVRNPFDMVLSNYFYHSQDPTPEKWVHNDLPCMQSYDDKKSLASHVLPTFTLEINGAPATQITIEQLDRVKAMCQSLFRKTNSTKEATFYEHLMILDKWDGLRLATAQMIISSSAANAYLAGGDVLRMANNLIKFQQLKESSPPTIPLEQREKLHVLTMDMEEYISNTRNTTIDFFEFVFGKEYGVVSREQIVEAAEARASKGEALMNKNSSHVTQGHHEDKEALKRRLRHDPILGPILNETEILVNEALRVSREFIAKGNY